MRNKHLLWEKIRHFLPFLPINEWELVNRMLYGSLLVGGGTNTYTRPTWLLAPELVSAEV